MLIEWSNEAKHSMAKFYTKWNDIDVFVEDTALGYEKFYTILLGRLLQGKIKIHRIFGLKGKSNVISKCRENQIYDLQNRPQTYIIDGDLELLNNEQQLRLQKIYVLEVYCIENILIDEEAVVDLIYYFDDKLDKNEIRNKLKFSDWIEANDKQLSTLFVLYAMAKKFNIESPTVGIPITDFLKNPKDNVICEEKTGNIYQLIKRLLIEKIGQEEFDNTHDIILEKTQIIIHPSLKFVSGKNYLMPLMLNRIREYFALGYTYNETCRRIANCCNLDHLKKLGEFILAEFDKYQTGTGQEEQ